MSFSCKTDFEIVAYPGWGCITAPTSPHDCRLVLDPDGWLSFGEDASKAHISYLSHGILRTIMSNEIERQFVKGASGISAVSPLFTWPHPLNQASNQWMPLRVVSTRATIRVWYIFSPGNPPVSILNTGLPFLCSHSKFGTRCQQI